MSMQENGKLINVKVRNDKFKTTLTPSNWALTNLPTGVTMGTITRLTDTTSTITLSGNFNSSLHSII